MNIESATNEQLKVIVNDDKFCTPPLLGGVAEEMIKRHLWDGIIMVAGKKAYKNLNYILEYRLQITMDELIHIGHIEIMRVVQTFKEGMRTFKTYVIMCLITRFKKMKRDAETEKRLANIDTQNVDGLDENLQTRIFQSSLNVERCVINKIMIEDSWEALRDIEKRAIFLEHSGYSQYEIADILGIHKRHGNTLLRRAYAKLRKQMGA